jgi:hypothetical protein
MSNTRESEIAALQRQDSSRRLSRSTSSSNLTQYFGLSIIKSKDQPKLSSSLEQSPVQFKPITIPKSHSAHSSITTGSDSIAIGQVVTIAPTATSSTPLSNLSQFFRAASPIYSEEKVLALIPKLPVLETMHDVIQSASSTSQPSLENKIFVCGQHLLESTASLFLQLVRDKKVDPKDIYVVGKSYSNNAQVIKWLEEGLHIQRIPNSEQEELGQFTASYHDDIKDMWDKVYKGFIARREASPSSPVKDIVVLDDGGMVMSKFQRKIRTHFNPKVVGIEQTSSGLGSTETINYPAINLASSFLKNTIEPPMVIDKVALEVQKALEDVRKLFSEIKASEEDNRLKDTINDFCGKVESGDNLCYGIIGYGAIGKAVLKNLIKLGKKLIVVYDIDIQKKREIEELSKQHKSIKIKFPEQQDALIASADIIIGCTGKDATQKSLDMFKHIPLPKILISCSSKDIEFLSLILEVQKERRGGSFNPLDPIVHKNGWKYPLLILRGGFPINFDNTVESVPSNNIQLVRGMLLQSIYQACEMIDEMKKNASFPIKNYKLEAIRQLFVYSAWASIPEGDKYYPTQEYVRPYEDITEEYIEKFQSAKQTSNSSSSLSLSSRK